MASMQVPSWIPLEPSVNLAPSGGRSEQHIFMASRQTICKKSCLNSLIMILVKTSVTQIPIVMHLTPRDHCCLDDFESQGTKVDSTCRDWAGNLVLGSGSRSWVVSHIQSVVHRIYYGNNSNSNNNNNNNCCNLYKNRNGFLGLLKCNANHEKPGLTSWQQRTFSPSHI